MGFFSLHAALGVLLITALAMNVSRVRIKERIGNGDGGNPLLKKAIRTHMNAIEHIVPFSVVLFALTQVQLSTRYLAIFSIGFIFVRFLHSYSMLWSRFKLRQVAAGFTYLFEIVGCFTVLFKLATA